MPDQTPPPAAPAAPVTSATPAQPTAPATKPATAPSPAVSSTPTTETKPVAATPAQPVVESKAETPRELEHLAERLHPAQLTLWIVCRDLAGNLRNAIEGGHEPTADQLTVQFGVLSKALESALPHLDSHQQEVAKQVATDAASLERLCRDIQISIHQQ